MVSRVQLHRRRLRQERCCLANVFGKSAFVRKRRCREVPALFGAGPACLGVPLASKSPRSLTGGFLLWHRNGYAGRMLAARGSFEKCGKSLPS